MSFRMMTIAIAAMSLLAVSTAVASERHTAFSAILDNHVSDRGLVNYTDLCADARLAQYTQTLSNTDWAALSGDDQLAFWINAYNAFTLSVVCDSYPIDSINDLHQGGLALGTVFNTTIWDKKFFVINGEEMSLGHIEHNILREGPEKARIHFAIVCAAVSCPPLRAEAYEGARINDQLEAQGRIFLARADLNRFDLPKKRAYLSGIFKWFRKDFGRDKTELLRYLARYAPDPAVAESLRSEPGEWRIKWNRYDWSLNEQ